MDRQTGTRKIAWLTGASSGIGRAVALKLADNGWQVAASARSADKLSTLAAERPGLIHAYPVDVTDGQGVKNAVKTIEQTLGPIDLALFSAGSYKRESAREFDAEALAEMANLNVTGTGNSLQAVMEPMIARQAGQIAVIASVAGYLGLPGGGFYGATKAALINLCEALRPQLEREGVTLQLISPGFVDTPLTKKNDFPMPFLISQEKAADAIVAGLSSRRFEIVFPWQMAVLMKLLQALPYALSLAMTRRMLRKQ
ncbi:Short-chain dehydrogenase [Rhizobium sp. NFR07]|uniref:SDR family NAD(P)-dependent oxidoreductase n=1 Tax=Rhizobium sp. NFR07 TaxID=1566262 RepID=UPI0008E551FD|nr:SDR family NAD(P)-dependent oxidoreductase [Rhizobium sp. NFR07]SFB48201.1 Short-chain dehydrogenase [Rhizobium sp. NFR07]